MMFRKIMVLVGVVGFLVGFTVTLYAQPDTLWTKTFGGSDLDVGPSVQ